MKCDEVRAQLPSYVDGELHPAGAIEVHLATCARCGAELDTYRELLASLHGLRELEADPPEELLPRLLELVPSPSVRGRVLGAAQERRLVVALASLGGAAVGATALALVWWRLAHRGADEHEDSVTATL